MTEEQRRRRRSGQAVSGVVATTGVIVWALERYAFGGEAPAEVQLFAQWGVPAAAGFVAAELERLRPRRRTRPE